MKKTLWQASRDVFHQRAGEDHVLILMPGETYFTLNALGGQIWQLIQDPLSIDDICAILMDEYEVERETCRMQTQALLEDMERKRLVKRVGG